MDTRGWSDYAYNGSACPHGFGFIGRGRGVRSAAQGTTDGNNRSYAIQYLGAGVHGGVEDPLTEEAKRAFYDMAAYLAEPLKRGHRDWKSTSCPGDPTYAWRTAGFPRPAGTTTQDWLEMATEAQVLAIVRGETQRLGQYLALGQGNQAFPSADWGTGTTNPELLAAMPNAAAIANAVVTALPAGSVDANIVKEAVKQALREGTV
jgi:hypothetical protein